MMWDPGVYQQFGRERARPFHDLLDRVDAPEARRVVDLGCGPGDATATLLDRFPAATVVGVDNSAKMIEAAGILTAPRLSFVLDDVRTWRADEPIDVLVSNATLQWIPEHLDLLPDLATAVAPGGWLAFQVPGNFASPSHTLLAGLRQSPRWRETVGEGADRALAVHDPDVYLDTLSRLGFRVDAWETTYLHVLGGPDAVLRWTGGTALRPVLAALDEAGRAEFTAEYATLLRAAYPERPYGTVFPFRRLFVVAQRPG